jgi:arabinoxylan arabinofuranohydrolase
VNVIPLRFNPDGSIPKLPHSKEGITKAIKNLNPFQRTEAETIAWEQGVETAKDAKAGIYVTDIDNGDYIKVRSVDFLNGAKSFEANVASAVKGGSIEIRLDSIEGDLLGTLTVKSTGGTLNWSTQKAKVKTVNGVHDVYFVFKGPQAGVFNFNWWKFIK